MNRLLGLLGVCFAGLTLLSCSSGQQLVSITVTPASAIFGSPVPVGVPQDGIQLMAVGNYAHPPAAKDLTGQVVWKSNIPDVAPVDATGKLTAGPNCGVAGITASFQTNDPTGNVVIGSMTATVDGTGANCPVLPI
jgi:hypothetical protein